jgi:NADPH:quinone reductase-like Zn-dependent oxidoreductase
MKAARLHALGGPILVQDISVPQPLAGAVLVRVEAAFVPPFMAGIVAGSGYTLPPMPFTPGIDAVGRVERVGPGVSGLLPGARVYCNPFHAPDGSGRAARRLFIGSFALGVHSASLFEQWRDGAYAEMVLLPQECVIPVPPEVTAPAQVLCRLGWLGTAHAAFRKARFAGGEVVIVHGATGLLGSSAVLLALALGASLVQVSGRDTESLNRLAAVDPRIVTVAEPDRAEPAALLLSCVSGGEAEALARLLMRLQGGGECILIGAPERPFLVEAGRLLRDQISIRGSLWHETQDIDDLFALSADGRLDLSLFAARTFPLAEINVALAASQARTDPLAHVAVRSPGDA